MLCWKLETVYKREIREVCSEYKICGCDPIDDMTLHQNVSMQLHLQLWTKSSFLVYTLPSTFLQPTWSAQLVVIWVLIIAFQNTLLNVFFILKQLSITQPHHIWHYWMVFYLDHTTASCMRLLNEPFYYDPCEAFIGVTKTIIIIIVFKIFEIFV